MREACFAGSIVWPGLLAVYLFLSISWSCMHSLQNTILDPSSPRPSKISAHSHPPQPTLLINRPSWDLALCLDAFDDLLQTRLDNHAPHNHLTQRRMQG